MPKKQHIGHNFNNKYLDESGIYRVPPGSTKVNKGFKGNQKIKKILFSEDTKALAPNAFADCKNLTYTNQINMLEQIPEGAFSNTGLRCFSASKNLKSMGDRAFKDCKDLEILILNPGLKEIGMEALSGTKIRILNIVGSLSEITGWWTSNLTYLTRVTIESGVEKILDFAFSYTPLVLISIPKSIIKIALHAFLNCKHLRFIIAEDNNVLRVQSMLPEALKSKVIKKNDYAGLEIIYLNKLSELLLMPTAIVEIIAEFDNNLIFNYMVEENFAGTKRST